MKFFGSTSLTHPPMPPAINIEEARQDLSTHDNDEKLTIVRQYGGDSPRCVASSFIRKQSFQGNRERTHALPLSGVQQRHEETETEPSSSCATTTATTEDNCQKENENNHPIHLKSWDAWDGDDRSSILYPESFNEYEDDDNRDDESYYQDNVLPIAFIQCWPNESCSDSTLQNTMESWGYKDPETMGTFYGTGSSMDVRMDGVIAVAIDDVICFIQPHARLSNASVPPFSIQLCPGEQITSLTWCTLPGKQDCLYVASFRQQQDDDEEEGNNEPTTSYTLQLYDCRRLTSICTLLGHDAPISSVQDNHVTHTVASGNARGDILLHDIYSLLDNDDNGDNDSSTTALNPIAIFDPKHNSLITDLKWSLDGTQLASTSLDGSWGIWQQTQETKDEDDYEEYDDDDDEEEEESNGGFKSICFTSGNSPKHCTAWCPTNGHDSAVVGLGTQDGAIHVREASPTKDLLYIADTFEGDSAVTSILWLPDGSLCSGRHGGIVDVWKSPQGTNNSPTISYSMQLSGSIVQMMVNPDRQSVTILENLVSGTTRVSDWSLC